MSFLPEFEQRIFCYLLNNNKIANQYIHAFDNGAISDVISSTCISALQGFYSKVNIAPEYTSVKQLVYDECQNRNLSVLMTSECMDLVETAFTTEFSDDEFIKQQIFEYVKKQEMMQFSLSLPEQISSGEISITELKKRLNKIESIGNDNNKEIGIRYFTDIEQRDEIYKKFISKVVATRIRGIDEHIKGGLSPGELGLVIGVAKHGKSLVLLNFALNAVQAGYLTVYYTLEMTENEFLERSDSNMSKENINSMTKNFNKITIAKILERRYVKNHETFYIKEFPTGCASHEDIEEHMDRVEQEVGKKPDLIVVDYLTLLKPSTKISSSSYENYIQIAKDLKGMSKRLGIPVWSAMQINRGGAKKSEADEESKFLRKSDIGDAYAVITVSDVNITLNRTDSEYSNGRLRLYIESSRKGKSDIKIYCKVDYNTMTIEETDPPVIVNIPKEDKKKVTMYGNAKKED